MKIGIDRISIIAISAALASYGSLAHAEEGRDTAPAESASVSAGDIIVTGTRRTERTAAESLAPVDVIDARSLATSPSADLNDKLAQSVPSFNVQRIPGADGVIFSRPASLRNLSPDQTLVLVNGHRRHRAAFVDTINQGAQAIDLSQIPSISIGRVEVLRDGASAQYGSDAIAGVINILLDDTPGTVLSAQAGGYYEGDGFNVQLAGKTGFALPGGGHLTISGDYNHSDATDRSVGIRSKLGQPDLESYHVAYNLALPLSDRAELYSFGTLGRTQGWNDFSYRSAANGDGVFRRSYYQDGVNAIYPDWSLASVYPDGFIPRFGATIRDGEAVAGVKFEATDTFNIDLSGSYGRNSINYRVKNTINASQGPASRTSFDSGTVVSSETSANLDAAWLVDAGLVKPVSIAFGAGYRHENFESVAGEVDSYAVGPLSDLPSGAYGFPGISPQSAGRWGRHSVSGYLDVDADVTDQLTLGAAGRYEDFSDFGSNFSYKFSGRYALLPQVAVRATYNTGFHAPAPGQQHFTKVTSTPDLAAPAPYPILYIALVSPTDPLAASFGGKALKAEKSRNVSVGLVVQPTPEFTLTADYYHIDIDDRIGLTPQLSLPAGSAYNRIQFLINGYDTSSNGVDVVANWTRPVADGRLTLTGAYNYNRTKITRADAVVVNDVSRPYIEDSRPRHTAIGTASFDTDRFHLTGRVRYYGSFVDAIPFDQTPFQNQKVPGIAFVDLSVSYDLSTGTQITVGAENLLNTYPAKNTSIMQFLGLQYPWVRPYDEDGGRWYVRVVQKF